jgi:hypothetical protein
MWLGKLGKLKNPVTSLGIKHATFRVIVVQCPSSIRYRTPPTLPGNENNFIGVCNILKPFPKSQYAKAP